MKACLVEMYSVIHRAEGMQGREGMGPERAVLIFLKSCYSFPPLAGVSLAMASRASQHPIRYSTQLWSAALCTAYVGILEDIERHRASRMAVLCVGVFNCCNDILQRCHRLTCVSTALVVYIPSHRMGRYISQAAEFDIIPVCARWVTKDDQRGEACLVSATLRRRGACN